ncbi:hypothetical protein [Streptomyces sp. RK75]|uniref:hypothetical protein n=1 Tax=Streptomyces sp. RK75 TaxID=2824895 RepID=UPI0027DCF161|nr:hypothetical protein [Streptomyces sp. RK75]
MRQHVEEAKGVSPIGPGSCCGGSLSFGDLGGYVTSLPLQAVELFSNALAELCRRLRIAVVLPRQLFHQTTLPAGQSLSFTTQRADVGHRRSPLGERL